MTSSTDWLANEYDDKNSTVISPQVADITPQFAVVEGNNITARISLVLKNNYSNTISELKVIGVIPFTGNRTVISNRDLNSNFTSQMINDGVSIPEDLQGAITVYYSDKAQPTKDVTNTANNWKTKEQVTNWSSIKTFLIDFNDYVVTSRPLVVVTAPGPGSGKMAVCLSQLYQEQKHGIKAGYAKFETFPIWNLPLNHPVNIAYEAATADLDDVNMIDPFHLEAYGKTTVNYNRDIEIFPVLDALFKGIYGENPYKSPTDMGVNMAGFCISDDEVCCRAAKDEVIRRYYTALGDMASGKSVTTTATNTYFGEYYGAGIGGTALDRVNKNDDPISDDVVSFRTTYTKGQYVNNLGVLIDYDFEFMPWSNSAQHVGRLYFRHAKLSTAKTHTVSSTLTGCTVNNNYYGGGFVGSVEGTATSVLDSCTINGSVFAGGNSGTAPKARVYDMVSSSDLPTYISGVYINTNKNLKATSEEYTWTNDQSIRSGNKYINEDSHLIYSATSLSDLGRCASTNLTIKGTTLVHGSVYGGGNEAVTGAVASTSSTNTTQVLVEGNSHVERDVFGGGKQGMVYGSSTVVVGARPDANDADDNATLHRPWIEGDI